MARRMFLTLLVAAVAACGGCKKMTESAGGANSTSWKVGALEDDSGMLVKKRPGGPDLSTTNSLSMKLAYDSADQSIKRALNLLSSVKNDASARAAAPKLGPAAAEMHAAMRQLKKTVAALDLAGRKAEILKFYEELAQSMVDKTQLPSDQLQDAIERVALGPQGPLLRSEINAILDALLEGLPVTGRERLQRRIQEKGLRG